MCDTAQLNPVQDSLKSHNRIYQLVRTKAEHSNMQEIWQEVSDNKNIYSRLWSFGIRSLHFRECGLYEVSDLLLGDHLTEKSNTVK